MISERPTVDPRQREAVPIVSWRPTNWVMVIRRIALVVLAGVCGWLMVR